MSSHSSASVGATRDEGQHRNFDFSLNFSDPPSPPLLFYRSLFARRVQLSLSLVGREAKVRRVTTM